MPNYFRAVAHIKDERRLKYQFFSDLRIITSLRPAIQAGFINILELGLCQNCLRPYFERVDSQFTEEMLNKAEDYYIDACEAEIIVDNGGKYRCRIKSNIYDHGSMTWINEPKLKTHTPGKLNKSQIKELGIIRNELKRCLTDLRYHGIAKNLLHSSFITDHSAQETLAIEANIRRARINDALKVLFLETPIFENVPLEKIVEIRKSDGEGFEDYRSYLNKSIKKIADSVDTFTPELMQEFYEDNIQEAVRKLDKKVRLTRESLLKKAFANVSITGICLGACLGMGMSMDVLKAVGAITYVSQTIAMLLDAYKADQNVVFQEDDLYFLWKVNKQRSAQLNN